MPLKAAIGGEGGRAGVSLGGSAGPSEPVDGDIQGGWGGCSGSGTFQWTEISSDFSSGGTIINPTSAVTTVTGLKQGTFYFQLSATSGNVAKDTVVVRVDYDVPPANSTLVRWFNVRHQYDGV